MSIEVISEAQPRARKAHRCFDCGRMIACGEKHLRMTLKYDDVYTLRSHIDCHAAAMDYISHGYWSEYEDGIPPLHEMIEDGGGQDDLDAMRGHWPHVVCRLELRHQFAEIAAERRLAEWRRDREQAA